MNRFDWIEISMLFLGICFGIAVLLVGVSMLILALNLPVVR